MKRLSLFFLLPLLLSSSITSISAVEDEDDWQVPVTLNNNGWMRYVNARFGMAFPVPPGMKAQRPPENGGGQAFVSADDKATLVIFGSFNVDGNGDLDESWKDALSNPERTITYKVKKADWYVVSGVTKNGLGFYEKYTANAKYCAGWSMSYPQADEKKYSAWIERIAKGFEPRLGKGLDTTE